MSFTDNNRLSCFVKSTESDKKNLIFPHKNKKEKYLLRFHTGCLFKILDDTQNGLGELSQYWSNEVCECLMDLSLAKGNLVSPSS